MTAGGFYGPQGRQLRAITAIDDLNERFAAFRYEEMRVLNYEMETAAIFGLGGMLGHRVCSVCTVVANRSRKEFISDHAKAIDAMIVEVLERATA